MNTMSGILLLCGALIAWEISAISFTNKKIIVPAQIPGQKVGLPLFSLVCAVILMVRWGTDLWTLACVGAIAAATLINFFIKNGLSEYGMYLNGMSTAYKDMKYYDFERKQGELNRVRVSSSRKDSTLLFTDDQLNLALAYFDKNKVLDMETYKMIEKHKKMKR